MRLFEFVLIKVFNLLVSLFKFTTPLLEYTILWKSSIYSFTSSADFCIRESISFNIVISIFPTISILLTYINKSLDVDKIF